VIALQFPVHPDSPITQTFAEHVRQGLPGYNGGIDWGVPTGTPVKAAQDGQVVRVGRDDTGYGIHVRVRHADGYLTIYGHMLDFAVVPGQTVEAGDIIGHSDNTGNSTGSHLHFELRRNNVPIDPAPFFLAVGPEEAQAAGRLRLSVSVETLNIRSGPGVQYPAVGRLQQGEQVSILRLAGDTWAQIGPDRWCAFVYGQDIYLEPPHA